MSTRRVSPAPASPSPARLKRRAAEPSSLEELMRLFEKTGPLRISFEDTSGVLRDVTDMAIPLPFRIHTCEFCLFAKSRRQTFRDCIVNKTAVNRLATRRMAGFSGQCHLGLTDIVEPLIYKERVLGIFYYGSVVVRGTENKARARIFKYCAKRKVLPAPFLAQLKAAPKIDIAELGEHQARLRLMARLCVRLLEAHGLPIERYRTEEDAYVAFQRRLHPLAQATIRYVHMNYSQGITLSDTAAHVKCHPDYLCRVLKRQFGCGFSGYLQRVRIDHARRLISSKRFSLGEIAFQVGFNDQSYFNKVFKALVGCTPGDYSDKGEEAERPMAKGSMRPTLSGML